MSQIEVLLDYLNKDSLYHLSNYIEKHNDNKELTLIVKRLILKRKNKEDI